MAQEETSKASTSSHMLQNLRFIRVLQGVYTNKDTFFHGTAKRMPPFFLRVQRAGG